MFNVGYSLDGSIAEYTQNYTDEYGGHTSYFTTVYKHTYDLIGNCISMTRTEDNEIMHKEKYSYVKVEVLVSVIKQLEEDYGIKINVFPIEE